MTSASVGGRFLILFHAGRTSAHICAFEDVLPTLCDVAGATPPTAIDGVSFLPTLVGEPQPERAFLAWDFPGYGGQLAVRQGRWKAVRQGLIRNPAAPLELYDLDVDPTETSDDAADHPAVAAELGALMVSSRSEPLHAAFRFGEYPAAR